MSIEKFKNKIIHGNSLEILQKIPDNSVNLIFADPPYDWANKHLSEQNDDKTHFWKKENLNDTNDDRKNV